MLCEREGNSTKQRQSGRRKLNAIRITTSKLVKTIHIHVCMYKYNEMCGSTSSNNIFRAKLEGTGVGQTIVVTVGVWKALFK